MCETMFANNECQNDVKNDVNDVILIVLQISQISQIVLVFPLGVSHLSTYTKASKKTNISYPLIHTRTSSYQAIRKISFSQKFAYVLNE